MISSFFLTSYKKSFDDNILIYPLQLASLNVDFIEITQDADGIIPEQIIKVCEERLRDGRPLPKVNKIKLKNSAQMKITE